MIRYTVTWHSQARSELARLWVSAADRAAIATAADEIDRRLENDASKKGRRLGQHYRVLTVPPLQVLFEVVEADRMVRVEMIRLSG
ncbi:MAG: hypothetical protein KY476_26635 [Planctomycetes bacterium]|nr:hypothetical protein [Planctomycetota bacterium]